MVNNGMIRDLPPGNLTATVHGHLYSIYLSKRVIFYIYVSLPECIPPTNQLVRKIVINYVTLGVRYFQTKPYGFVQVLCPPPVGWGAKGVAHAVWGIHNSWI